MSALLVSLWPLFALIVLGYVLRRIDFPGDAFWSGAERLNYYILFPALLFSSLSTATLNSPALPRLAAAIAAVLAVGWLALLVTRRLRNWPAGRFGALTQGLLRFNTYLGLATVSSLYGNEGLAVAALLLAVKVPAINVLSVWALSASSGRDLRTMLAPVIKNPLILSCLIGAAANFMGLRPTLGLDQLLKMMAATSLPLGLLCVGAALRVREMGGALAPLGWNTTLRLLLMPTVALFIATLLHLPTLETQVLVLFFALPTAPSAYVLTRQLGGEGQLMAALITVQTLAAAITLPLMLALLLGG
ncbi:transporter [Lampropedia cohaerens]|uniref:Transporter n=1 Tax=Lampropedia cohaerens TaxID=1610491 RepID=A0A0U1Q325_9BURK|nr:AEC family transporter [Lampropedia cohaerens]KKW69035.1 transporter [Lampropedia cohaerens]